MARSPRQSIDRPWTSVILAVVLAGALAPASTLWADWSTWRGPQQDGLAEAEVFGDGPFELEILWKRDLGSAYSGVSVVGDRALTMYGDGTDDLLVALETATGNEIWRYRMNAMTPGRNGSHNGPLSTPVSDGEHVYGLGSDGRLFAVTLLKGEEVWSVSLVDDLQAPRPNFGFTTAPLLTDGVVVVQAGAPGAGVVAFDKASGEVRWKAGEGQVDYRSPVLGELGGRPQVIAPFKDRTYALEPASGEVLWTLEHTSNASATPLVLEGDRVVLTGQGETTLYRIESVDGELRAGEEWRNTDLKGSFAAPVRVGGQLYGYNRNFLTAVDVATGERTWRSRPPGGRGVIAVDGHLVLVGSDGDLVVAEASSESYTEKARVPFSELGTYTSPSFAGGHIFVRDLSHIAAVRPRAAVRPVKTVRAAPTNAFESFLRRVEASDRKNLLVDEFMKKQQRFPIVEGDRLVHFVYRGKAEDVAIRGTMAEFGRELSLSRVEGTDLFYRTFSLEPGGRWEYDLNVDFENRMPDPLNPRWVAGNNGAGYQSELDLSGRTEPDYVRAYEGEATGRTESFSLASEILGNERDITVYLPHGYDDTSAEHPVIVVHEGGQWLAGGQMANTLDHVSGEEIAPAVVAFVSAPPRAAFRELSGARSEEYVRMLVEELKPALAERYRLRDDARSWVVLGKGAGAVAAAYAALLRPDVFGHAVVFSYLHSRELAESISDLLEKEGSRARFELHWNRDDFRSPRAGWDIPAESREFWEQLKKHGFEVSGGEARDGGGWGSWRTRVVPALAAALPAR